MLQLLVMRHAKSDWNAGVAEDHDRRLAGRGVKAARRMGRFLTELDMAPDLVMSSTAARALATVELAAGAGAWSCPIEPRPRFYSDPAAAVLAAIAGAPAVGRLMVVGHEPIWSELVSLLIGGGAVRMVTAAVACVELDVEAWSDVTAGIGRLSWLAEPKLVTAGGRA